MPKKQKEGEVRIRDLLIRYLIPVAVAFPNLYLFYLVFTPLTIYPVHALLSLFFGGVSLAGNTIYVGLYPIEIINACVAGSAYYLLLILNLSTPGIKLKKRIMMVLSSFTMLLVLNILRIVFLSFLYVSGSNLFEFAHALFWYVLSSLFVVGIWFFHVRAFKIKGIPFYSDIRLLYGKSVLGKKFQNPKSSKKN